VNRFQAKEFPLLPRLLRARCLWTQPTKTCAPTQRDSGSLEVRHYDLCESQAVAVLARIVTPSSGRRRAYAFAQDRE
jgi:hypothetical protein